MRLNCSYVLGIFLRDCIPPSGSLSFLSWAGIVGELAQISLPSYFQPFSKCARVTCVSVRLCVPLLQIFVFLKSFLSKVRLKVARGKVLIYIILKLIP